MKIKIILILVGILLMLSSISYCKPNKEIKVLFRDKLIDSMTVKEFNSLVVNSEHRINIKDAESNKRVEIHLKDNPWVIGLDGRIFKTEIKLVWFSANKKILKEFKMSAELEIPENGSKAFPKWRKIYRDFSEVGFILSTISNIILLIIIIL